MINNPKYEFRKFENKYILKLFKNTEIITTIRTFCEENKIKLASISGIGAINSATFGFFNPETKQYQEKTFSEPMEITSLTGTVTEKDGETYLHIHMNAANKDYNSVGGHLVNAVISLTGEIIITQINGRVEREFDKEIGLNLFNFL